MEGGPLAGASNSMPRNMLTHSRIVGNNRKRSLQLHSFSTVASARHHQHHFLHNAIPSSASPPGASIKLGMESWERNNSSSFPLSGVKKWRK